ncbi:hypothetical protein [Paenibacillus sp. GCM10027626]|uniref:hypothetical protein n=1 Tax=Paenibacillus sp. GCM10027626 TaxID=3273411 RepID=UPI0036298D16
MKQIDGDIIYSKTMSWDIQLMDRLLPVRMQANVTFHPSMLIIMAALSWTKCDTDSNDTTTIV